MPQALSYCGVRSLCGREIADEMFGLALPRGLDMDFSPDQEMVANIAADLRAQEEKCAKCQHAGCCW